MRIVITGGGTGGHINPAIAIAEGLRQLWPTAQFLYVGSVGGMEEKIVPNHQLPYRSIRVMGIDRRLFRLQSIGYNLRAVKAYFQGRRQAMDLMKEFSPDLVVATGGYVSAPVLQAAKRIGAKTVIHESNAFPGVTTRMLAKKMDLVLGAVEATRARLDDNTRFVVTGNPVREEFLFLNRKEARKKLNIPEDAFLVLSSGGSLGATQVNLAVAELLKSAISKERRYHIHATGKNSKGFFDALEGTGVGDQPDRLRIFPYIHNMPDCFAAADLVISRSGAMSLAEIQCGGKASILIPSPNVTENHQYFNAKVLSDANAAILLEEKDLTGEGLVRLVEGLEEDLPRCEELGKNARKLAIFDANQRICEEIRKLMEEN